MRRIAPWRYTTFSKVMSPTRSTTSTTQRLLQRSSRMNPATWIRSLRTRAMRNSTMRLSEKRYLHHCSFRSETNQRTGDKLITLMKKVCCQLSPSSHTLVRGDPYANLVCTTKRKSSREMENERIRILLERQKEQILAEDRTLRSISTNFKPILIEEVSRN